VARKNIVILGAGGSVGAHIAKAFANENNNLVLVDMSELGLLTVTNDLEKANIDDTKLHPVLSPILELNPNRIMTLCEQTIPTTVINAAAYKHVVLSELLPYDYYRNNLLIVDKAIDLSVVLQAEFIQISTDKAVWPVNAMGYSKRLSEGLVLSRANQVKCVKVLRFGNVLDSSGSVGPIFDKQIRAGKIVTVTDPEVTRFFMSLNSAANFVKNVDKSLDATGIYVLKMGEPVRIVDFAVEKIRAHGKRPVFSKPLKDDEVQIEFIGLRRGEKLHEVLSYGTLEQVSEEIYISNEPLKVPEFLYHNILMELERESSFSFVANNWETFDIKFDA
jgi:FlaA1/EpsC-like NDP-sugar epimerase